EVRFLLRALELARPGGHVALVLPSGVLANERLRAVRAELLARCTALAVIALPRETFRQAGTHAACSILLLQTMPAPADHHVFFALPTWLDDLPGVVAAYHDRSQIEEHGSQSAICNLQSPIPKVYWLPQAPALARRLDAHFWRPDHQELLERLAARNPLLP